MQFKGKNNGAFAHFSEVGTKLEVPSENLTTLTFINFADLLRLPNEFHFKIKIDNYSNFNIMNQNFPLWTMLPGENGKVVAE